MNEVRELCAALMLAKAEQRETWLATVIRVDGSAYRRTGARVLFDRDGVQVGAISAGCIEADLVKKGAWLTRSGPVIHTYESQLEDDPTLGNGCSGTVTVLVEAVNAETERCFIQLSEALQREQRVALVTVLESEVEGLAAATHLLCTGARKQESLDVPPQTNRAAQQLLQQARFVLREGKQRPTHVHCEGVEALVEVLSPPPHVFVFGAGADVVPVARLANLLGWNISVCTPHGRPLVRDRFVGKARLLELPSAEAVSLADRCVRPLALVMAHDFKTDCSNLGALLDTRIPYIGVLGPGQRTERMLGELERQGRQITPADLERIHGPAGLRLGAETSAEIALSIMAEAQACLTRTEVGSLRDFKGALDARPVHALPPLQVNSA